MREEVSGGRRVWDGVVAAAVVVVGVRVRVGGGWREESRWLKSGKDRW